jgi:hypothetical protein
MTILQLSEFIKIPSRTVFHWAKKASATVSDKMAHAKAHNKAADLTMSECLEVVRAGGNHVLAEFLEASGAVAGQSGKVAGQIAHVPKLPNGAQLRETRILAEKKILTNDQVADALGIPRAGILTKAIAPMPAKQLILEEAPLTPDETEAALRELANGHDPRPELIRTGNGHTFVPDRAH